MSSGFLLILDEAQRAASLRDRIEEGERFTDALSLPDWKIREKAIALLGAAKAILEAVAPVYEPGPKSGRAVAATAGRTDPGGQQRTPPRGPRTVARFVAHSSEEGAVTSFRTSAACRIMAI